MNNIKNPKSFLPQLDGRALDFIKICAAIFMVTDHVNSIWLNSDSTGMYLIGRATFPLFCFAVAAAVLRAPADRMPKYIGRLLIFALVAEPFSQLARDIGQVNILFTLAAGALFASLLPRLKSWQVYACYAGAILSMLLPSGLEYGLAGVVLPAAFLQALQGKTSSYLILPLLLFSANLGGFAGLFATTADVTAFAALVFATALASTVIPIFIMEAGSYFPKNGRYLPKYFLHVFYPLQFFVLWLAKPFFL